ncbi:TPA: conjugative transfer ATPase [Salmonella enterica subsp. enterica serovar Essen]|nr:conjugative transfer ATPase [Salmonella enterica]EHN2717722.1 conjugative transfer ATPase [Salmonella enterica subsp. enterica serovar Essen]EBR5129782.1 conjugative transfer ATPase [Salmonella enterica]EHX6316629.1 conjugative transfer ATPase [Salmonella enterica subsp. enterica serovar Essen]EHX6319324.1 conjugative transfer ATPase [Salmonella enterica subsp. enterica serovar Essen]
MNERRGLTEQALNTSYRTGPSFVDRLPWVEFLPKSQTLLLEDGRSVGAVFELNPVGTEGRSTAFLEQVRDTVTDALQDAFDEHERAPWVVQFFCQDEDDSEAWLETLATYATPEIRDSAFTREWLAQMANHMAALTREEGLFLDNTVTRTRWRATWRRTRMVVYRWLPGLSPDEPSPEETLNHICERLIAGLKAAGISAVRQNEQAIHRWLVRWFNPAPPVEDRKAFWRQLDLPEAESLPVITDFAERLLTSEPRSDAENGVWWLDNRPHKVVVVDRLRKAPPPGLLTGETARGDGINALFDLLPAGTIMNLTVMVYPQDKLEQHISHLADRAIGDNTDSEYTRRDCHEVRSYLKDGHKLYRSTLAFYLHAPDTDTLFRQQRQLHSLLLNAGLVPVQEQHEVAPLSHWLRWLPMCFDPLNKLDRAQNGHLLLLGPTGAGKSATLNAKIAQLMALHRPRLFIIEAGNSFGLMADYAAAHGLTVNKISLRPGSGVTLPLFSDAWRLVEQAIIDAEPPEEEDGDSHDQRDVLGEMEITARLMITGGEAKEDARLTRPDRAMIRQAIIAAAHTCYQEKRQTLTQDIRDALFALSRDNSLPEARRQRAYEMAESINLFCAGFEGELFNREGQMWPEADITLVDLATFAREGYEAQLAISYISLINHINNIGERDQHLARPIVNITDEAHIITVNPLLARFLTKGSKMWRKLGIWLWLATQNLADFPDEAKKLLNMIEWWELLVMPPEEIEQVCRFKALTEEQRQLLRSAVKSPGQYTEGVVLSPRVEALFRVVPPALYLALAMTEKHEKAERMRIMKETGCSEMEAAKITSKK